jgi:hypothetical protein
VPVQLGLTDGIHTELLDPALPEGTLVVTGLATTPVSSSPSSVSNPLMGPQRPPGRGAGR